MKTKYIVFIATGLFFCSNIYSQNIIEQFKQFVKNADMDCYIAKIQKNVNDYFVLENKTWGNDKYGIVPQKIDLRKDEIVPLLAIQFVNTDTFNLNDDIYNYITIDSAIVFTFACVDKKMKVHGFAHFYDGVNGYYEIDKDPSIRKNSERIRLKHVIKNIQRQKPELILYNHVLCGFHDSDGFMFVKDGKIYVYRIANNDIHELNEYIRKFISLERIRKLNYAFIPIIYQNGQSTRRTGFTPENEKIICPLSNLE